MKSEAFVDIHCHLVPGVDDGSKTLESSLEMARMAVSQGFSTIICTPHQLGSFSHNRGEEIRRRVDRLQVELDQHGVDLEVLPGADVRIEPEMMSLLRSGDVLSLGDRRKHVLLELPHEIFFPLEGVINDLDSAGMVGILSHPERNQGILRDLDVLYGLVEQGCLMQVTAGSLLGTFGPQCQEAAEQILERGLCHFLATDAHGPKSRRPLMKRAFERAAEIVGEQSAIELCCLNPALVVEAGDIDIRPPKRARRGVFASLFTWGNRAA